MKIFFLLKIFRNTRIGNTRFGLFSLPKRLSVKTPSFFKHFLLVIPPRRSTLVLAAFIILVLTSYRSGHTDQFAERADKLYQQQLITLKEKIIFFKRSSEKKTNLAILKQQFCESRLAYKKVSFITEYFNILITKQLNYPALDRVEEDLPGDIIPPEGFQAIEQLLYSDWNAASYTSLTQLLDKMLGAVGQLENEVDRINKFREDMVWDALRAGLIRIITQGITGFDSPVAQYSLPETRASLEGMKIWLALFEKNSGKNTSFSPVYLRIKTAIDYITAHNNFNAFDRLVYISQHLNPLYKNMVELRQRIGVPAPEGLYPVNADAVSLFDTNALNINFFATSQEYIPTPERIALGKRLFFDPVLSGNNSRSCATCHQPQKAFTDGLKTPFAIDNKTALKRNTPTLLNSAFQGKQFWDSRADILENQLSEVVHNEEEMKGSFTKSLAEVKNSPEYSSMFHQAYSKEKEPISSFNIANAISSYIRSLTAMNSRFDQYMHGNKNKLTTSEKNGFNLFAGKGKCATCHFMPVFNGLVPAAFQETESEVLGVPKSNAKTNAQLDDDEGKFILTKSAVHRHSFKTPTLRNVALTAPYMHNGVFNTLEEVMEFYNKGGGKGLKIAPPNQSLPFDKLGLSPKEIADIIAFMKALTDNPPVK